MYVTKKERISAEVIKNLLSAHKRVAEGGNVSELIKLSRYLLHVSSRPQQELMDANWAKLSPESRIQLVLLSRELVKQEQKAARKAKLMADLNKLNKEGLAVALEWSETLRLDPRYR